MIATKTARTRKAIRTKRFATASQWILMLEALVVPRSSIGCGRYLAGGSHEMAMALTRPFFEFDQHLSMGEK
jgi:hypothetical protein